MIRDLLYDIEIFFKMGTSSLILDNSFRNHFVKMCLEFFRFLLKYPVNLFFDALFNMFLDGFRIHFRWLAVATPEAITINHLLPIINSFLSVHIFDHFSLIVLWNLSLLITTVVLSLIDQLLNGFGIHFW